MKICFITSTLAGSDKIWYKNQLSPDLKFTKIGIVKPNEDPYLKNERKTRERLSVQTLDKGDTT
jgi:hypothetical protein